MDRLDSLAINMITIILGESQNHKKTTYSSEIVAYGNEKTRYTVDGRHPAPTDMVSIPLYIYRGLCIPGGAGFLPSTVFHSNYHFKGYHDFQDIQFPSISKCPREFFHSKNCHRNCGVIMAIPYLSMISSRKICTYQPIIM